MARPYYVNGIVYSKTSPHLGRGTIRTIEQRNPKMVTVRWEDDTHQLCYTRDLSRTTLAERRKQARTRYWTGPRPSPAQRQRFIDLAHESYHVVGNDCWGERIPSRQQFLDVIIQEMADGADNTATGMTDDERALWHSLPEKTQRDLVLQVLQPKGV